MPDPAERFIEAATRPLGDNAELQMMAAQELRAAISAAPEGRGGDSLEKAAEKLEKGRPRRRGRGIFYAVTAMVAILAAFPLARDYMRLRLATYALFAAGDPFGTGLPGLPLESDAQTRVPDLFGNFSSEDRLLLFGDLSKSNEALRFKALWDSDPTNPAYFAEFAKACMTAPLPADFLETAAHLDPENAWFRYFAAGVEAWNSVEENHRPSFPRKRGVMPPKYVVKDPVRFENAIKLLNEAARMPRVQSYQKDILLCRLAILPAGDDVLGRKLTEAYLHMEPPDPVWMYGKISMAVAIRSRELAASGDQKGFIELLGSWESYIRRSIEASDTTTRQVTWPLSRFSKVADDVADDARILGLPQAEARFRRLSGALDSRRKAIQARSAGMRSSQETGNPADDQVLYWSASVDHSPPLAEADFEPGRRAYQSMRARVGSALVGALMLIAALLAAGMRFCRGMQVRRLSGGLLHVLRPADHAWILLGGVLVPVLVHWMVEHFIPLERIDFEEAGPLASLALRFTLVAGVMMTLTNLIAARRVAQRLGGLGWEKPSLSRASALGVGLAALLTGGVARLAETSPVLLIGWVFGIILLLLNLLIMPLDALFSPRESAVRWLTYCRAVVPAYVFAVLLMALLVPFHHAREKHWTRLNVLTKIQPGVPAMNSYEHEVAKLMRAELLEILDAKP